MNSTILVVGCGAIGGIYAAYLSKVAQVTAYDINSEHVAAMRRDGLQLSGCSDLLARFETVSAAEELEGRRFDALIVAVKSHCTAELIRSVLPRLAGQPLLFTLQNGQGNVELLLDACDWNIAQGMTWEAGEYIAPGQVRHLIHGRSACLGPARGPLAAASELAALLDRAGLPTEAAADPRGAIWSKFIFNCAMNPVSALLRGIPEAKYCSEDVYVLLSGMVREGMAVAEGLGITLHHPPLQLLEDVRAGKISLPQHPGSMAQDITRGAPTEIDALTGYMMRKAAELGVATPQHQIVYQLMKGLEFGTQQLNARTRSNHTTTK